MLFNSLEFLVFFAAVFVAYWSVSHANQNRLLLAASYFFYGSWNWKLLSLIMLTTATDFTASLLISRSRSPLARRAALFAAVGINLGILGFFKYYNFFVEDVLVFLDGLGIAYQPVVIQVLLPVGISFYTFQSMSYTIDVYRGEIEPTTNLIDYALYVSFFPQLVAGPIERASHLLPQVQSRRRIVGEQFGEGAFLILLGLFKKVVVADHLAMFVDAEFGHQTGPLLLVSLYFFAFQIYCDFSGYSDIARGVARLLGFDIRLNFDRPYLAQSLTEFWRRWHMSLSTWFRDYVYVPLGGGRGSAFRASRNLLIVFLLSGLWHGANWTFIVWGAIHGVLLVIEKTVPGLRSRAGWRSESRLGACVAVLITFHVVVFAWIFFRAESLAQATDVVGSLWTFTSQSMSSYMALLHSLGGLAALLVIEALDAQRQRWKDNQWIQGAVFASSIAFILVWGQMNGGQFIYFQF